MQGFRVFDIRVEGSGFLISDIKVNLQTASTHSRYHGALDPTPL